MECFGCNDRGPRASPVRRSGLSCRIMVALIFICVCSLLTVFKSSTILPARRLLLATTEHNRRVRRLRTNIAGWLEKLHLVTGSSDDWVTARAERRRRDEQRSADASECFTLNGQSYRGRQHVTKSGLLCQPWAAQTPNTHHFHPAKYLDAGLEANFCRNPDEASAPWCYNGDGTEPRWETCDIPLCPQRFQEVIVPAELIAQDQVDASAGERLLSCPTSFLVDTAGARASTKYNGLATRIRKKRLDEDTSPLHHFSFYGATSPAQWDHIVRAHCARMRLKRGQTVFEAGSAAGAFVDSLARQYGVSVAGCCCCCYCCCCCCFFCCFFCCCCCCCCR
jgi:hypothetical protein